jgi:hypothetical protein
MRRLILTAPLCHHGPTLHNTKPSQLTSPISGNTGGGTERTRWLVYKASTCSPRTEDRTSLMASRVVKRGERERGRLGRVSVGEHRDEEHVRGSESGGKQGSLSRQAA